MHLESDDLILFHACADAGSHLHGGSCAEERLGLQRGDLAGDGHAALQRGGRLLRALRRVQLVG